MPRSIALEYHLAPEMPFALDAAIDDVVIAFRTSNVDLVISKGDDIRTDPETGGLNSFDRLLARYRAGPRNAGQIIVARKPRDGRADVAGELLDQDKRGVAAIYMSSLYIAINGVIGFTQTLAHEIGHMMDLGHGEITSNFTSVMTQARDRAQALDAAWSAAQDDAVVLEGRGTPAFFQKPIRPINCYPFAPSARSFMNTRLDPLISPWGGPYSPRADGGVNDREHH